jgi:uncharacterized protein with GYD domain
MLLNYTDQGMKHIKESPNRLDAFKKAIRSAGGELRDFFLAMGKYDLVMVVGAPDDAAIAKIALSLGALGNVRSETYSVFTEDEYRKILGSL